MKLTHIKFKNPKYDTTDKMVSDEQLNILRKQGVEFEIMKKVDV